jgi:urea transport system ATP-binding protein
MLTASQVNQFYGESHILWDAQLDLQPGALTCLMGRNGVGKTTFLKVLMGLLPARSGSLQFQGQELLGRRAEARAQLGIGYVPQGREIFPQLTVEENLRIGMVARGKRGAGGARSSAKPNAVLDKIFELFPVLKQMLGRRGGDLSGGQQQQLAIGRALALEPKVLILDEPTEGIQPNVVHEIGDVLLKLNQAEGLALLLVEQKLPFARRVGKSFVIMDRGRTVASGPMTALSDQLVQRHLVV